MQRWFAKSGIENHTLELTETRICLSRDTGTPESYGANYMPYPRFLRSKKWQDHVAQIYGQEVLLLVLATAGSKST